MKKRLIFAALCVAASGAANADPRDDALSAMLRCSALTDRNARLGCFDATIVRVMLVPATMALLGERNWYVPKWLERILPDVHFSH